MNDKKNIAVLDIGTNSFHLIIVEVNNNDSFKIIDRERDVLRLSTEKTNSSFPITECSIGSLKIISENEIYQAIELIKKYKKLVEIYNAEFKVVATSAVREAENSDYFINKVYEATKVKINVIEGQEEGRLIYSSVINNFIELKNKKILCIDIGGGSTEFIIGEAHNILFLESLKIGAVRLTNQFIPDFIITKERIRQCRNYVIEKISSIINIIQDLGFEDCVGTSGTIQAVKSLSMKFGENDNLNWDEKNYITYDEVNEVADFILSKTTLEERLKIIGLESKRADIIPAGVIILQTIFDVLKLKKMYISNYALREGVVIDMIEKINCHKL
ncbi:MAG: hypothetical protein STSR0008_01410 [Ignavibacterium sp.]